MPDQHQQLSEWEIIDAALIHRAAHEAHRHRATGSLLLRLWEANDDRPGEGWWYWQVCHNLGNRTLDHGPDVFDEARAVVEEFEGMAGRSA